METKEHPSVEKRRSLLTNVLLRERATGIFLSLIFMKRRTISRF